MAAGRAWELARSLQTLRAQLNALAPHRSTASDGSIGDTNHLAEGWTASDHNPWWPTTGLTGLVRAIDVTHDPTGGMNCHQLADMLIAARDPRALYVIWNGWISDRRPIGGHPPWTWLPYTGTNPHDHHLHLSVVPSPACDDPRPWALQQPTPLNPESDLVQNFRVTGDGVLPLGCPTGKSSSITGQAWVSALVDGPDPGSVRFWFQSDTGGISDVSRAIPFGDGRSGRVVAVVPDGTTMIRVEHHFKQSGTICLETKPKP